MQIYIVQNNDGIIMGVFQEKDQANLVVKDLGKKIWNEKWHIETKQMNTINGWLLSDKFGELGIKIEYKKL